MDSKHFKIVYKKYFNVLHAYSRRIVMKEEVAEDIVQEVFLECWDRRGTLDVTGSLKPYLYTLTRTKSIDHLRKSENKNILFADLELYLEQLFFETLAWEDHMDAREMEQVITTTVRLLPPKCKDVFLLNGTALKLLPEDAYSWSDNPVTIKSGENSAKLTVTLNSDKVDYDDFLLTIAIKSVSRFSMDTERNIHYLTVSRPAPRLDRSGWTIADFSTEEASGEGAGQGVAACVLDGDATTFWHSQWAGATGQLPHHITIDMQKEVTVASVDLQRRNNNSDTYRGHFYVSSDNQSFTQVGSFEMAGVNEPQTFKVNTTRARYIKVEITESRRTPFANLAEVYVRGAE